jgi:hypothetical protein
MTGSVLARAVNTQGCLVMYVTHSEPDSIFEVQVTNLIGSNGLVELNYKLNVEYAGPGKT